MPTTRPIHPDVQYFLDFKGQEVIDLFKDLRNFILEMYPESNELLYHTHALSAVFSLTKKLSDAFCHIPIYTEHLNLGFNKGNLLPDPDRLLKGTGKLIRHIEVKSHGDYRNPEVEALVRAAIDFAREEMTKPGKSVGKTISKIKKK